jgi:signal transduction histidine kinase
VKAEIAPLRGRLPKNVEIALFRVLQESLTNVHRHSGASNASIHFQHDADAVILEIRDFGKGIPAERMRLLREVTAETGVGLTGMRERMHELNGTLEIESDVSGTSMRATVPLNVMRHSIPLRAGGNVCASACA